jgi:hypothetical protein
MAQHADGTLTYQPTRRRGAEVVVAPAAEPDIGSGFSAWTFALQLISGRA